MFSRRKHSSPPLERKLGTTSSKSCAEPDIRILAVTSFVTSLIAASSLVLGTHHATGPSGGPRLTQSPTGHDSGGSRPALLNPPGCVTQPALSRSSIVRRAIHGIANRDAVCLPGSSRRGRWYVLLSRKLKIRQPSIRRTTCVGHVVPGYWTRNHIARNSAGTTFAGQDPIGPDFSAALGRGDKALRGIGVALDRFDRSTIRRSELTHAGAGAASDKHGSNEQGK
jgi:hypothetical protein